MGREVQSENSELVAETFPEIKRGKEILYLTQNDVMQCNIEPLEVLELIRIALAAHGEKLFEMPAKIGLHPIRNTLMHAMPAYVPTTQACGIKWVECFPENHNYELPQTSGLLILNDVQTGWPVAVLDAIWITAKRTPAVSALAIEKMAPFQTKVVGILGCGLQGKGHVEILPAVLPKLEEVRVYDIRDETLNQLFGACEATCFCKLTKSNSIQDLVVDADIIITATSILTKPEPQIRDEWIKSGALLLPVDFDSVFEWETMKRADKFVVDSLAEMEYFMSIGYLQHGLPPVHAELGEIVAGLKPGRETSEETIMNMNIGMGVEDVVVAKELVKRALQEGVGTRLPI